MAKKRPETPLKQVRRVMGAKTAKATRKILDKRNGTDSKKK